MSTTVDQVLQTLREDFPGSKVTFTPDGSGGGAAIVECVDLGPQYSPQQTWLGAQLTTALPYADIYPLFIGNDVKRADGREYQAPISKGHVFAGRPAIQVSLRTNNLMATTEAAASKFTKALHFIREAGK